MLEGSNEIQQRVLLVQLKYSIRIKRKTFAFQLNE